MKNHVKQIEKFRDLIVKLSDPMDINELAIKLKRLGYCECMYGPDVLLRSAFYIHSRIKGKYVLIGEISDGVSLPRLRKSVSWCKKILKQNGVAVPGYNPLLWRDRLSEALNNPGIKEIDVSENTPAEICGKVLLKFPDYHVEDVSKITGICVNTLYSGIRNQG